MGRPLRIVIPGQGQRMRSGVEERGKSKEITSISCYSGIVG